MTWDDQPVIMPVARREAARIPGFVAGLENDQYFVAYWHGSPVGYACIGDGKLVSRKSVLPNVDDYITAAVVKYTEQTPSDLLDSPIPFIYDIDGDEISVGHPGTRTSDIPGKFTPGGILEGMYEPGGRILIRSMTNMPYTVRHLIELWYYQHPELEVKSVHLKDDQGGFTKLAARDDIGNFIKTVTAADPAAREAARALIQAGGNVYVVGGAVRDAVMGKEPKDIDLMVQGLEPTEVQVVLDELDGRTDVTGKDFGVFRFRHKGDDVEIALPRKERSTGAGHKDFAVTADPHLKPEEDLYRRDFTANAMAVDLKTGRLLDPYKGQEDIKNGVLRAHNPDSLSEDPLRVVRALVANAKHGLAPEENTQKQMTDNAESLKHLPAERVQAELDKLFSAAHPAKAMRLARDTGVLGHILPEVDRAFGYDQNNPHHQKELGEHLLSVLEGVSQESTDPDLRLAALLHDIGKPDSAWIDPVTGKNHFYKKRLGDGSWVGQNHEEVGGEMARNLMTRLKYPTGRTKRVGELVDHHMWAGFTQPKGARKFLQRVGDHADDLFTLRKADMGGKGNPQAGEPQDLVNQRNLVDQVRNTQQATEVSQLAINGRDLMDAGIPQGPQIGYTLQELTNQVIEDPTLNTRENLLKLIPTHARL